MANEQEAMHECAESLILATNETHPTLEELLDDLDAQLLAAGIDAQARTFSQAILGESGVLESIYGIGALSSKATEAIAFVAVDAGAVYLKDLISEWASFD